LAVASGIYWGLIVQNFIEDHSDLTFLLHNVERISFLPDTVCIQPFLLSVFFISHQWNAIYYVEQDIKLCSHTFF